jgi:hypothetical protein
MCQIRMSSEWNQSSAEDTGFHFPKVSWRPMEKSLKEGWRSRALPPTTLKKRSVGMTAATSGVPSRTIDSGPSASMASSIESAICVRASSQVIRSHWPLPRSPILRNGWVTRS